MFALSNVGAEIQMFLIECNWTWRGFGLLYNSCQNAQPASAGSSEGLCLISPLRRGRRGGPGEDIAWAPGPLSLGLGEMPFSLLWGAPFSGADHEALLNNSSFYLKGKIFLDSLPSPMKTEWRCHLFSCCFIMCPRWAVFWNTSVEKVLLWSSGLSLLTGLHSTPHPWSPQMQKTILLEVSIIDTNVPYTYHV